MHFLGGVTGPVDAMPPANEDVESPQAHQHRVPVVVVAQQRSDEEGEEDRHGASKEEPREAHLSARHTSGQDYRGRKRKTTSPSKETPLPSLDSKTDLLHADVRQDGERDGEAQRQRSD